MSEIIKNNIEGYMGFAGLKPKDMAKACGKTVRTWFYWMADPDLITVGYLRVIASTLGVSPAKLLEERKENESS